MKTAYFVLDDFHSMITIRENEERHLGNWTKSVRKYFNECVKPIVSHHGFMVLCSVDKNVVGYYIVHTNRPVTGSDIPHRYNGQWCIEDDMIYTFDRIQPAFNTLRERYAGLVNTARLFVSD